MVGIPFYPHPTPELCKARKLLPSLDHDLDRTQCLDFFLDLDGRLQSLLLLLDPSVGLGAHDTTTPLPPGVLAVSQVARLDGTDELGELVLVLGADLSDGEDGSSLISC